MLLYLAFLVQQFRNSARIFAGDAKDGDWLDGPRVVNERVNFSIVKGCPKAAFGGNETDYFVD